MPSPSRTARIAGEIKKALAENLHTEIKDPRLSPMAAVTRVELTRDLAFAKVFISVYGEHESGEESVAVLSAAAGHLRHVIAKNVDMRVVPSLKFVLDDSAEYSAHISRIINEVIEHDRRE